MLVDSHGKPLSSSKKPIRDEVAVVGKYDKYSSYPSEALTPQKLAAIFKEADNGNVQRQMELFEEMEGKDTHLFSELQTRKNAVTGIDFEILPYSDDHQDKKICEYITNMLYQIEDIEDVFMDLLDAIGKGFSMSEIMWGYDGNLIVPEHIKSREQKKFLWDDDDVLKVITDANPMGIVVPENKFIMHRYKARSGHPSKAGVIRVCSWMYLFKNYDVKDWVAFCEVYGMPLRLGKYSPGASSEDKASLMQAIFSLGADAAGIIPDGTSIEFIESNKQSSVSVFESLANFCNKEMSKAILGQTLTTDIGDSGSFAASKTHGEVRQDLLEADCKSLAQTIKRDLIRPLVLFNFGDIRRLPYIKFHCEPPEDLKQAADTYKVLISDIGLPIAQDHLYDKFGIPKPKEGEALVTPITNIPIIQQPMKYDTLSLKNQTEDTLETVNIFQKSIDFLADNTVSQSAGLFSQMFKPIMELVENSGDLEGVKKQLEDPKMLVKLLEKMNNSEFNDLLSRAMFTADIIGRWLEDEQHRDNQ